MNMNTKQSALATLTKNEIQLVSGGGFFRKLGEIIGSANQKADEIIKKIGEKARKDIKEFQAGIKDAKAEREKKEKAIEKEESGKKQETGL